MPIGRLFYEISGDSSKLNAEMQKAQDALKGFDVRVSAAGQRLISSFQDTLNPTKALTEQLQLLQMAGQKNSDIWAVMGGKFKTAADQAKRFGQEIPAGAQAFLNFGKSIDGAGMSVDHLGKSLQEFASNPLHALQSGMTSLLEKVGPIGVGLGAVATGAVTAMAGIFHMAEKTVEAAHQIENLSFQTGLSVVQVQSLSSAARLMGVESDAVIRGISALNIQLGKLGGGDFTKAMVALGISLEDAGGKMKTPLQLLGEFRDVLLTIQDPSERVEVALAAVGRKHLELARLLLNTKENWQALAEYIEKHGSPFTQDQLNRVDQYAEKVHKLEIAFDGFWNKIKRGSVDAAAGILRMQVLLDPAYWKALFTGQGAEFWKKFTEGVDEATKKTQELAAAGVKAGESVGLQTIREHDLFIEREKARIQAKDFVDLRMKLAEAEREFERATQKGKNDQIKAAADRVIGLKLELAALEEFSKVRQKVADLGIKYRQTENSGLAQANEYLSAAAALWKALKEPISEVDRLTNEYNNTVRDLNYSTSEAMAKTNKAMYRDMLDVLPKITKETNDAMDNILLVNKRTGVDVADVWKRQVSTIVSDFSRGFADIIFAGKSFGETLKNIFVDMAKSIVRTMVELLFQPLQKYLVQILTGLGSVATAAAGTGGGGFGLGGPGVGGLIGGASGALAGLAGGAGGLAAMLMPGGFAGKVAGGLGAGLLTGAGAISAGLIPGMGAASFGSALGFMGSGAGLFGSAGLLGMGAMTVPALGAAAVGLYYGIKALMGQSTQGAGSKEVTRDLGINVGKGQIESFIGQYIDPKQAWGIRKDLYMSPAFLSQVAGPTAEQEGRMDQFLESLEAVKTSWGTFNFRGAFELGKATGDWAELNKQFVDAFEHSSELEKMLPNWETQLLAVSDATETVTTANDALKNSITALRDAISSSVTTTDDMWNTFLKTGVITDEFAQKIKELGGNLEKFQELAGDIGEMSGLQTQLTTIDDLIGRLQALQPQATAISDLFAGKLNEAGLTALGLNPQELAPFASMTSMVQGWQQAVSQFQQTSTLAPQGLLEQALSQYGGAAGATAISNYAAGFNTITPLLLTDTFDNLQAAYQDQITKTLDYLNQFRSQTVQKITDLDATINDAKKSVVDELDKILASLDQIVSNTALSPTVPTAPVTITEAGNPVVPANPDLTNIAIPLPTPGRGATQWPSPAPQYQTVHIHMENSVFYSPEEWEDKLEQGLISLRRRASTALSFA